MRSEFKPRLGKAIVLKIGFPHGGLSDIDLSAMAGLHSDDDNVAINWSVCLLVTVLSFKVLSH